MPKPVSLRYGQSSEIAYDGHVVVRGLCNNTGKSHATAALPIEGLLAWSNGMKIQDALPEASYEDREFLMTGLSPEGWDNVMGPEE